MNNFSVKQQYYCNFVIFVINAFIKIGYYLFVRNAK